MTPHQAHKALGDDPCRSCPEHRPRHSCAKRPGCKAWERYCFRRKVVAAYQKKDKENSFALNRMRYTFKTRRTRADAQEGRPI